MSAGFHPIISLLIEIKNAQLSRAKSLDVAYSKYRQNCAVVLKEMGFIDFKVYRPSGRSFKRISLSLKKKFTLLRIFSRPGRRVYARVSQLQSLLKRRKLGTVLSTSRGIMGIEAAVKKSLGGELLFEVG